MDLNSAQSVIAIAVGLSTLGAMFFGGVWWLATTIQRNTDQLKQTNKKLDKLSDEVGSRDETCLSYRREYDKALNDHGILIGLNDGRIKILEAT
jgi:hypothetical protein